ncbi:MAG: right-handed parallel beta-helix repeat-containing protein [Planctomycetes bacterium]|nr:right-handed parallel beta-helix repeat-containing protein [Planctomycetota bacterium]
MSDSSPAVDRRHFLGTASASAALTGAMTAARAADAPAPPAVAAARTPVTNPRSTSGDLRHGPKWDESFTLTVGNDRGDLNGTDQRVLQAAVDSVARMGGGTVKLLPGTWRLRNAVYLCSNLRLVGSGPETVLMKEASVTSKLSADSDWYDQEVTLADAKGFKVGDGICLRAKNPHHGGATVIKRTLVARSGNRFKLDKGLRENLWASGTPTVSTLFPLLSGEFVTNVTIENLALDGNKANNEELDGNYAGCVFMQDCADVAVRKVIARDYRGDGISWQICHDVLVEGCESRNHTGLGLHPGSGSQRPVVRNNTIVGCHIGLFFCWGVKYGLAEKNTIEDTKTAGISVGHRDTDNLIRNNTVKRSGQAGILFRPERGAGFTGDRNTVEGNTVLDTGGDEAAAVDVQGTTANLVFRNNTLKETRGPAKRVGFRLGKDTKDVTLDGNTVEGFAAKVDDRRK